MNHTVAVLVYNTLLSRTMVIGHVTLRTMVIGHVTVISYVFFIVMPLSFRDANSSFLYVISVGTFITACELQYLLPFASRLFVIFSRIL